MSANKASSTDFIAKLESSDDWEEWLYQFKGLAVSKKLWGLIQGTEQLLVEPINPDSNSQDHERMLTRSQSQSNLAEIQKVEQLGWAKYESRMRIYTAQIDAVDKFKAWI